MTRAVRSWRCLLGVLLLAGAFVPDGRAADQKIAFAVDMAGDERGSRIYLANPDGSGARPVSHGAAHDRAPAFSPDGKKLAYQSSNELGVDTVAVQSLDAPEGEARTLAVGGNPQWSRDGQRILFSRRQLNEYSLYVIAADGSQKEAGLKPIARGRIGRWSPDEKQLAVVAPAIVEGKDRWQIQVMPADTRVARLKLTLPEAFGQVVSLDWSPDGESLLFSVVRQNHADLYVVDLKSPDPRKVPAGDAVPNPAFGSWSPDGKQILFRSAAEGEGSNASSRLCLVKADGTGVRPLWEPENRGIRIQGTAWYRPNVLLAQNGQPSPPVVRPAPPAPPEKKPEPPPAVQPNLEASVKLPRVLGTPRKLHGEKLFSIDAARSPVSVALTRPGAEDFVLTVPVLPTRGWRPRRQGVGITLELEDGGLYRGTVIYSGVPWVTLQGRPKGGKVRLIDGKKLPAEIGGFGGGFQLTVRREGTSMVVAVDGQDMLSRPLLTSPVKGLSLTLETFDPGPARFNLGGILYTTSQEQAAPAPAPAPSQ